jgi:hypothetical protein
MKKLSTEEFIAKARLVHGDKYDYSKSEYINNRTKVTIICPIHQEFEQIGGEHLKGKGCKHCADNQQMTTEQFIAKAVGIHGDKYDYSFVDYKSAHVDIQIRCKEHNLIFNQSPSNHLAGKGCPSCRYITMADKNRKKK